jgi:class 3 adenylate cyclase
MREALVPVVTDQWEYVSDALGGPAERDRFPEAGSDVVREAFGAAIRETWTPSAYLAHQQAFRETDVSGELTAIAVPTLVISTATPERGFFELARDLARAIPKARLLRVTQRWDGWEGRDYETLVTFLSEGAQPSGARTPVAPAAVRTVLFTDLVGHTEMMQRLGDARGRDVLREHERITRETLKNHDGAEVKTMGDGFMASFGSVTQAMECAIALQRAFAAHTASMPEPLHVRVGLNAGEPIEEDGDLFGSTVILASRIAAQAGAGEILVPETVRGLLSGKPFVYADRGEFVPKGFDDAVRLYEVRWREEAETP